MARSSPPSLVTSVRARSLLVTIGALCGTLPACDRGSVDSDSHLDAIPNLRAEAEMRIGDVDDPDLGFSRVTRVDVDSDGNVYAMEASVPEIRVFSPDGVLQRRIGRRGAGPGEFHSAPRFGVVGDTVWAVSRGPDRITLFDRDGNVLSARRVESVVVPLPRSIGHVLPWTMRSDGKFTSHLARVSAYRADPVTGVEPTDSIPVPFVLFDHSGAVIDTIGWAGRPPPRMWSPPSSEDFRLEFVQFGGRRLIVPRAPILTPWWEALPDGYLLVEAPLAQTPDDGAFMATRFGLFADTVYHQKLYYHPVPYSSADLDTIAVRAARGEPGGMVPYIPGAPAPPDWEATVPSLRNAMEFPEFKLPIEYPWLAQDESVWLRLSHADPATARWLILDPEGRPRGQLELPSNMRIRWSRGDTFWAVEPDELDVPWLVRFRLSPG